MSSTVIDRWEFRSKGPRADKVGCEDESTIYVCQDQMICFFDPYKPNGVALNVVAELLRRAGWNVEATK